MQAIHRSTRPASTAARQRQDPWLRYCRYGALLVRLLERIQCHGHDPQILRRIRRLRAAQRALAEADVP